MIEGMHAIRARRGQPFTLAERSGILDRYRDGWQAHEAAEDAYDEAGQDRANGVMSEAAARYIDAVPIVSLSRSPFSGEPFETSLDIHGIDGLWWSYEDDYRPHVVHERTFLAWTGSMKLNGPLSDWSLKAMVGPEVPFVMPRILSQPDVRAVVSSVLVGDHVGMPVVYFADPAPDDLERVDDWGHRFHYYTRADGTVVSAHSVQDDDEKDFDLVPWFRRGKLLWIEPGDPDLRLRSDPDGCPYFGLDGERRRRYIKGGKTWLG